jgi:hypothetical protein
MAITQAIANAFKKQLLEGDRDKTATSGTFTVQFPAFTTAAAILRISG